MISRSRCFWEIIFQDGMCFQNQVHYADCQGALDSWYKLASKADWANLIEVQSLFPKAEAVGNFTVFNIKGNHYRLVVSLEYEKQLLYIKYVLTHAEYDQEKWKDDPYF